MPRESPTAQAKKSMLEVFINYLSKTPPKLLFIHLFWMIIASCVLSASYIAAFHFTSVLAIYNEVHSVQNFGNNLRAGARKDQEIDAALTNLLEGTSSNRAYVFRYHNGLAAVSGVPFFFQTLTHEVISPGTSRVMQFEQRIPASINMAMSNKFMQNMCSVVEHAGDDRDSQNYWYFQVRNAQSLVRCPIFMQNGDLFGFVGIDYTGSVSTQALIEAQARVRETAAAIAAIFTSRN